MGRRRGATQRTVAAGFLAGLAGALLLAGCGSTGVQTTHSAVPGLSAKAASFDEPPSTGLFAISFRMFATVAETTKRNPEQ